MEAESVSGEAGDAAANLETINFRKDLCFLPDEDTTVLSEASTALYEPYPVKTTEINTTEIQPRGRKNKIHNFFRRAWKAINPLRSCKRTRVELLRSLENLHPAYPEPVPGLLNKAGASAYEPNYGSWSNFYTVESVLGCGSFGKVVKAVRKSDGKEVAIKNIRKRITDQYFFIPGCPNLFPKEVVFLQTLRRPLICPYVIELYEWFDQLEDITLVMEYPRPCEILRKYTTTKVKISEGVARGLMRQLVLAVQHCIKHGVFHNDIHPDNILVNTRTMELKLIDFGCAHRVKTEGYDSAYYVGALLFCPPEVFEKPKYHAVPTNVWSLGIVLYYIVNGNLPFNTSEEILDASPQCIDGVSTECRDLINKCLSRAPESRPALEQIVRHQWLMKQGLWNKAKRHMQSLQHHRANLDLEPKPNCTHKQ